MIIFRRTIHQIHHHMRSHFPNAFLFLCCLLSSAGLAGQGVGINPTGQPPHPGAMLDVNAPNKGLLVPRTQSASVTNPAAGMIVYDTVDMQLELYNGMQWLPMMTGGASSFWWADADGDTYGDPFNVIYAPTAPPFFVANSDDCDDTDSNIKPSAPEICDGIDNDCDGLVDDDDPGVQGLQTFYQDLDGDGYGTPAQTVQACLVPPGYSAFSSDCDDDDPNRYPGAPELCDDIDNNCDGEVDENATDCPAGLICAFGQCVECVTATDCPEDGLPCTIEVCTAGSCGTILDPSTCFIAGVCYTSGDPNPLAECQVCDPGTSQTGWTFLPAGTPCTTGVCDGIGSCVECITASECEDGFACTIEICIAGVCFNEIDPNTCFIAGICYNSGDPNPVAECQVCNPAASQTSWTNAAAGTPCGAGGECDGNGNCN
jgi:hypothetical protein